MKRKTIVIASGYFLTYHAGHEEYLRKASELGEKLIVVVNNDHQQKMKYGRVIVPWRWRYAIISSVKYVDIPALSLEDWTQDISHTLGEIAKLFKGHDIIFAKGGDRKKTEIPEAKICEKLGIKIVDGLGKKIQSSSKLLKEI